MNIKKVRVLFLFFVVLQIHVFAQQTPLYSLYVFNDFIVNPAIASLGDSYSAQVNNRYQFIGIENAPVTATLSLQGPLKYYPMGWGTIVFNDSQGALSKFGVYGSYAYKIQISTFDVSFGLHLGVIQHTVDLTKIKFLQEEVNINESTYTSINPDATFGMFAKNDDYYAGFSLDQLFNNKIQIVDDTLYVKNETINRLKSHFTLVGGYNLKLSSKIILEPTLTVRQAGKAPTQAELTTRLSYNEIAWAGLAYRTSDAVVLMLGYNYRNTLQFAYAYDVTYSALRKDTRGAHEVMVKLHFNKH